MTTSEILRKAAEELATRGHAKRTLETVDGRVCLLGAIGAATDMSAVKNVVAGLGFIPASSMFGESVRRFFAALGGVCTGRLTAGEVARWNDDDGTTEEDVGLFLLLAAEAVEDFEVGESVAAQLADVRASYVPACNSESASVEA